MIKTDDIKKLSKAGIILFDRGEAPTPPQDSDVWQAPEGLKVLACYTQGRFDAHGIYLVPPKGSIDPLKDAEKRLQYDAHGHVREERPVIAAVRECREETGVDVEKLLGVQYADFLTGKTIENIASTGYPGVEIVHASAMPVSDHTYTSGHGSRHRAQYFAIEVRGIEKLRGELKSIVPHEHDFAPEKRKTSVQLAKEKGLPSVEQMMDILRTGYVRYHTARTELPPAWANEGMQPIMEKPVLKQLERRWLKARHAGHSKLTKEEWLPFLADLPKEDYKALHANFDELKHYLERKQLIGDCVGCMKMDTKDTPLNFYKEGGYIGRVSDIIRDMEDKAGINRTYARAVWGEYSGPKKPDVDGSAQMQRAQVAPFFEYLASISPMEVASAAICVPKNVRGNESHRTATPAPRALRAVKFADDVLQRRMAVDAAERSV